MVLLYHEKQVRPVLNPRHYQIATDLPSNSQIAALCGVHCINTLLQGPTFTELDLAQVSVWLAWLACVCDYNPNPLEGVHAWWQQ